MAQGKTSIPGVDDGEELLITDVSLGHQDSSQTRQRRVFVILSISSLNMYTTEFAKFYFLSITYMCLPRPSSKGQTPYVQVGRRQA